MGKSESYYARGLVEKIWPHTGDGKGDVSIMMPDLWVEVEVPASMVLGKPDREQGMSVSPEGLAHINLEVKKALFKSEQEYLTWRVEQLKGKTPRKGAKR